MCGTVKMKNNKGFTLVELLVVIAIIALLMGILMPALSRARMQAQAVVCGSNQKQLGLAWVFYANDNDDWFPMGMFWSKGMAWWQSGSGVGDYLPTDTAFQYKSRHDDRAAENQNLYKGWYCPTHAKEAIENELAVGYSFNYNIGYERYTKSSKIARPAEVPILYCFWDDNPKIGATGLEQNMGNYFGVPTDPATNEETWKAYHFTAGITGIHNNSTTFSFADGHAERIKDLPDQESYANRFEWDIPDGAIKYEDRGGSGGW